MCGRYWIEDKDAEMCAIIDALNRRDAQVKSGEIFPSDVVPVIANSRRLSPMPFAMRWGYALGDQRVINARSETAAGKSLFRDGMMRRRCLIPASGYFEWTRRSREATKYAISKPGSLLVYMAGVYRIENGQGEFAILTRSPDESVAFLHDRMPVILPRECLSQWLSPDADAQAVLQSAVGDLSAVPAAGEVQTISFL